MSPAYIINSESGSSLSSGRAPVDLREAIRRAGCLGPISIVPGAEVAEEIRRRAETGIERVIVGGGDGTVGSASAVASRLGLTLGVLPLGTRNHFARDLGVPLELRDALEWLANASVRTIDLGEVNGRVFINNVSVGLYPRIVREREKDLRPPRERFRNLTSLLALIKSLSQFRLMHLQLETDEARVHRLTPLLFVGNNAYSGDFLADAKRPSLSEGRLWVCTAAVDGMFELGKTAWRAWREDLSRIETLNTAELQEVTVRFRGKRKRRFVAIDGEVHRLESPLKFRILPGALKVLVKSDDRNK